jgi:hypothetical protein
MDVVGGAKVEGTQARAALIAGPAATAIGYTLTSAGVNMEMGRNPNSVAQTWVNFRTGSNTSVGAGFVSVGSAAAREFLTIGWSTSAKVQMVAWTGNYTDWHSAWMAAQTDPTVKIGIGNLLTVTTPASAVDTALATLNGMSSFALTPVPEPTTAAIVGMGLASLLVFRRRK